MTSRCVEFLLLRRGLTPAPGAQGAGAGCQEQPHLCGWELASAGVQEQGGFRVRVFPESLLSFWQSASPCFPKPGLYLHLSSMALNQLFIPKLSEGVACADAVLPKAPPLMPIHSPHRRMEASFCRQHTVYSKRTRQKGSWVGFFCSWVFGLLYLPAALAVLLSRIKVLPLVGSLLCFPLSELSKPHVSLSPDLLCSSPNHPEAPRGPTTLLQCPSCAGQPSLAPVSQRSHR